MGYQAAALLDRLMSGKKAPQSEYLVEPAGVVTRHSTDVLAIEDPDLANAVRFIYEHACDGIRVQDVVKAAKVSHSTLAARFRTIMGRTIHAEILRVRIERAKQLISTTKLPLKQVAAHAGFKSIQYMTVLFRRHVGRTPAEYGKGSRL